MPEVPEVPTNPEEERAGRPSTTGTTDFGIDVDAAPDGTVPGNALPSNALPGNALPGDALPGNALPDDALPVVDQPGPDPVPDVDTVTLPLTETRASRRAAREAAEQATRRALIGEAPEVGATPVLTVLATVALAALVGASGFSGQAWTGIALAFCGVVMAWGWPLLLGAPTPAWSAAVVGGGSVAIALTAGFTDDEDFLRWLPAAIGVSIVIGFLQQLLRRERSELTRGIASSVAALALATAGAPLAALPAYRLGREHLLVAMGALALTALAELLGRVRAVQRWILLPAVVAGAGGAVLTSLVLGHVGLVAALLIGAVVGLTSHVLRAVLAVLPGVSSPAARLSAGAASVLVSGVLVYLLTRVVVA